MNTRRLSMLTAATIAGVLLLTSGVALAKLRIGVVNMQRAVRETKEGKAAEAKLRGIKKKLENELNRKLKEFYKREGELRKTWSVLKDTEKRRRAADSQKRFRALQKRYLQAERKLMARKTREMLKITKKLTKIIERIAKRDKYDYIFSNAAVLWAPRHVDLTNEVIRQFDGK